MATVSSGQENAPFRVQSTDEKISAEGFLAELQINKRKFVRMNGEAGKKSCFAFKQKSLLEKLHDLQKSQAAAAVHRWTTGPRPTMTWKDFQLMSEITFTTAEYCFPCWSWGNKGGCYHQDAVRKFLGLPSLCDPLSLKAATSGRGRKRRRRVRHFVADAVSRAVAKNSTSSTYQRRTKKKSARRH